MREKICGIYKITNTINLKAYIGQSVDIENRWKQHKNINRGCTLLVRAFKKYGIENFSFEIVEICSPEELNEKEKYYISHYRTYADYGRGYNLTTGGDGSKGVYVSEIARKHLSDSLGGEPIYQFDLNGKYLGKFDYIADAERKLNIPHENIIKVLNEKVVKKYLNDSLGLRTLHEYACTLAPVNPRTGSRLRYDNEVVEYRLIIEVHGPQHFSAKIPDWWANGKDKDKLFEDRKYKDEYKMNYALQNGYDYLAISYIDVNSGVYRDIINSKINKIKQRG